LRRRKRNCLATVNTEDTAVLFLAGFSDHFKPLVGVGEPKLKRRDSILLVGPSPAPISRKIRQNLTLNHSPVIVSAYYLRDDESVST
jgi:hypothetical protein